MIIKWHTRIIIFTVRNMKELLNEATEYDPAFCPNGCGRSYTGIHRKQNLKYHMIYTCDANWKFKCRICHKKLSKTQTLKYHMATAHKQLLAWQHRFLQFLCTPVRNFVIYILLLQYGPKFRFTFNYNSKHFESILAVFGERYD